MEEQKTEEIVESQTAQTGLKLGPRMLKAVHNKLEATFANFRYHSRHLAEVEEKIWDAVDDGDLHSITLDQIVAIIKSRTEECHLVSKLYENLLTDINLRSKHYRTWFTAPLYLTEQFARSSNVTVSRSPKPRLNEEEE